VGANERACGLITRTGRAEKCPPTHHPPRPHPRPLAPWHRELLLNSVNVGVLASIFTWGAVDRPSTVGCAAATEQQGRRTLRMHRRSRGMAGECPGPQSLHLLLNSSLRWHGPPDPCA